MAPRSLKRRRHTVLLNEQKPLDRHTFVPLPPSSPIPLIRKWWAAMTSSRSFTFARHTSDLAASERRPPLLLHHCASECRSPPAGGSPCHFFACSLLHFSGCRFETLQPTAGHHCIDVLCLTSPLQLWLNRVQPVPVFSPSDTSVKVLALLLLLAEVRANFMFCFVLFCFLPP